MSKNPVIERAKLHFSEADVRRIEVPEWGEDNKPLIILCKPFNMAQKNKLYQKSASDGGVVDMSFMVDCLIMKALDENGDKIFTLEDRKDLMIGADPEVISAIATEMLKGVDLAVEDLSEN